VGRGKFIAIRKKRKEKKQRRKKKKEKALPPPPPPRHTPGKGERKSHQPSKQGKNKHTSLGGKRRKS